MMTRLTSSKQQKGEHMKWEGYDMWVKDKEGGGKRERERVFVGNIKRNTERAA